MKPEKKARFTFAQHLRLVGRGLRLLNSFPQPILLSKIASFVLNAALPFVNIYFAAQILGELSGARDRDRLVLLVLVTAGLNLAGTFAKSAAIRWRNYCETTLWPTFMQLYTDKLLTMDYIDAENPEVQQRFTEIRQHQNGMGFGLPRFAEALNGLIKGCVQIILSVTLAFSLFTIKVPVGVPLAVLDSAPVLALVALVILCSTLLAPYLSAVGGRIWARASGHNNKSNRFFSFYFFRLAEGSRYGKDIRIYDQRRLIERGSADGHSSIVGWIQYARYNASYSALSTAVSYLSNGLIYLYVALKALAGAFGVGSIVQYVGAITQFGNGIASIFTSMGTLANNNVFLDKSFQFLDIPNRNYQGTLSVEKRDDNEYAIEFRNVSFQYPGSEAYALKNLNLKFNIGRRMAVVGMNGSGKTTMIKLLCRLYDPTEGVITLNGIDIKKYNYNEYQALFSVVFQDFQLLPFPLGQNVASGMGVDETRAEHTLRQAGFGQRLDSLPQGLSTNLYKNFEEEGVEISGGEAQKIALARALYKNAPFIVLDEPTAALDPVAEYEIYTKFNELVGSKTAIYISHRLSSCRFCDQIAVFHEGRLIQYGGHETLLADTGGKYHELWNAQAQYYRPGESVTA